MFCFSKSAKNNNPGTFSCFNASVVSCIKRIFSPFYRPFINSVCELSMTLGKKFNSICNCFGRNFVVSIK